MPIPLHISPFTGPAGAPDLMGAVDSGLGMSERRKQGSFSRDMATKQFGQQQAETDERRRQFNEQQGVSEGYLGLQQGQEEERRKRREMEEQSKLFAAFQHATQTGDWMTAKRLQQEIQRRGLSMRPKSQPTGMGGQQAPAPPPNPFSLGAPTLDKPMY